jgi:hypothetical protein
LLALSDELSLGKAHVQLASSANISRPQILEQCREAEVWLNKCLPGYEEVRDHSPPWYGGAARVAEIQSELSKCQQALNK